MSLDNYEQETDIEINTPADIYRAMLDGCVAECRGASYSFNGVCFVTQSPIYGNCNAVIPENKIEQWTLWREKPKPKWWELASKDKPVICRYLPTGYFALYVNMADDWTYFEPLTDAEIDQLKRGF